MTELTEFFKDGGVMIMSSGGKAKARASQMKMAQDLNRSFHEHTNIFVEAPTGTGKTIGYIIPIGLYLRDHPKQRFVISVSTKHLQAQIEEDLGRMAKFYPSLKSHTVLKGTSNYLCLNRLRKALQKPAKTSVQQELVKLAAYIYQLEELPHGWREELPITLSDAAWGMINGEASCCQSTSGCYRKDARKQSMDSSIVVVNSDLMGCNVKYSGEPVPTHPNPSSKPILVMDEAHTFLGRMIDIESADLSLALIDQTIRSLLKESALRRDPTIQVKLTQAQEQLKESNTYFTEFLASQPLGLNGPVESAIIPAVTLRKQNTGQSLTKTLHLLAARLFLLAQSATTEADKQEYTNLAKRMEFSREILAGYLEGSDNFIMVISRVTSTSGRTHFNLALKPYELDVPLEVLWSKFQQVSLVSATLVGTTIEQVKKSFNGSNWEFNAYSSPFNYPQQMRVFLPPRAARHDRPEEIAKVIKHTTQATDGRVLALFTSYAIISQVQALLEPWCKENGYQIYAQQRGVAPDKLVEQYNNNKRAIILGNQSMGTGIDMSGLRAVIITKLPFDQFSPYQVARNTFLKAKGHNPFHEITLAETVRKFKQWLGRLVRREGQKGLIVLLDEALNTQSYKSSFLDALPAGVKSTHLYDAAHPLPESAVFLKWAEPAA